MHIGYQGKKPFTFNHESLKKHWITLGSSGSGKTVLTKILVEELAAKNIPTLIFDPQGDLASLGLTTSAQERQSHNLDTSKKLLDCRVFTPTSPKGIQTCVNPLQITQKHDVVVLDQIASSLASLIGYDLANDKGQATKAILYTVLEKKAFHSFIELAQFLKNNQEEYDHLTVNKQHVNEIIRKLTLLTIGKNSLLFEKGFRFSVEQVLQKPAINVLYLNSLTTQEEKEFFVSMILKDVYQWMLKNPSSNLQAAIVFDEIAPYIPAGAKKPVCKDILKLLFKQARKYGISFIVATQNPGDIDYQAFAQFNTWAIGRLTTKQDQKKVEAALSTFTSEDVATKLANMKTGQFLLYSPDNFEAIQLFQTRWLYTQHKTLTENDVAKLSKNFTFEQYTPSKKRAETNTPSEEKDESTTKKAKGKRNGTKQTPTTPTLEITIDSQKALWKAEWQKKRNILLFPKEHVTDITDSLSPQLVLNGTARKTILGLKQQQQVRFMVDMVSGVIRNRFFDAWPTYIDFTDSQIQIIQVLSHKKHKMVDQIAFESKLTKQTVTKNLQQLKQKRIASFEKEGSVVRWYLIESQQLRDANRFAIGEIPLEDISSKKIKERYSQKQIEHFLKVWFNFDAVSTEIVYMPLRTFTFMSQNGSRKLTLNLHTGEWE
ncbi:MAG: helicase HerA-like domain-containing protein [Candidatus Woesearchaeota archaeon]